MAKKRGGTRICQWFLLSLFMVVVVTGCSSIFGKRDISFSAADSSQTNCRMVQHVMGKVCVPLSPQRIVTLDSAIFANSLALDIKPIGAAMSDEDLSSSYLAGKIDEITLIPSNIGQFDLEKLLPLNPDLIVGSSGQHNQTLYDKLSQIAPIVILPWKEISYDWKQSLQELAAVLNKTVIATQLMNDYYSRVEEIKQVLDVAQNHQKLQVAFAFIASGNFRLALHKSFSGTILNDIGFQSPSLAAADVLTLPISEEYLPKIDADILFIGANEASDRPLLEQLQQKPLWSKIKAVQENQVYPVDFQAWYGVDVLAARAVLDDIYKCLVEE